MTPAERRYHQSTRLCDNGNVHILRVKTLNIQKPAYREGGIGTLLLEIQYLWAINKYWRNTKIRSYTLFNTTYYFNKIICTLKSVGKLKPI